MHEVRVQRPARLREAPHGADHRGARGVLVGAGRGAVRRGEDGDAYPGSGPRAVEGNGHRCGIAVLPADTGVAAAGTGTLARHLHARRQRWTGVRPRVLRLRRLEDRHLVLGRRLLVPLLPLRVRLAINSFACVRILHGQAVDLRPGVVPLREAVAAEAREIHEVDVLHVGAPLQVLYQLPKSVGLDLERQGRHGTPTARSV
mmetsp:Transcript_35953/g.99707  ORF Transcript_35953/g.99707 Transcript_35953/m.99707 type:complete len:202 (-) Transcript_35953:18-623(-)